MVLQVFYHSMIHWLWQASYIWGKKCCIAVMRFICIGTFLNIRWQSAAHTNCSAGVQWRSVLRVQVQLASTPNARQHHIKDLVTKYLMPCVLWTWNVRSAALVHETVMRDLGAWKMKQAKVDPKLLARYRSYVVMLCNAMQSWSDLETWVCWKQTFKQKAASS